MGINPRHLLSQIIIPACKISNSDSLNARGLLLGTCSNESALGYSLVQDGVPDGGLGPWQMERATHDDCWDKVIKSRSSLNKAMIITFGPTDAHEMIYNLLYAAVMCRIQYSRFVEPLPYYGDVKSVYAYYKKYWNTNQGAATEDRFIQSYQPLVQLITCYNFPSVSKETM